VNPEVPRTQEELETAAADFEHWLDELDPAVLDDPASRADDLRAITSARDVIAMGERQLALAVAAARSNGRSWGEIGLFLGVTKQAARKRFGGPDKQNAAITVIAPAMAATAVALTGAEVKVDVVEAVEEAPPRRRRRGAAKLAKGPGPSRRV
jgi:hypothetical protein